MLNQRLHAAREIHAHIHATERAIDAAVVEAADLVACMPRVRMEANLAAEIGHAALERAARAFAALIKARGEIVAAHQELNVVKDQVGLRTVALGGDDKRPSVIGLVPTDVAA